MKERAGFSGVFEDDLRAVCDADGPFRAQCFKILSRSIRTSNRQFPNAISRFLGENQRARFESCGALIENRRKPLIHRRWPFVSEPEDAHARLLEHAEREHVTEIEIEREHDARIRASARNDVGIWRALRSKRSDVHR